MTAKLIENPGRRLSTLGAGLAPERERPRASAQVTSITLSGTVLVEYEVNVLEPDGGQRRGAVRVQFPDEVRSMLETSTWSRGATILDVIGQLGAAYVERLGAAGLLGSGGTHSGAVSSRPVATFHLPLSDLRSSLAAARSAGA